jgi:hypothetical protein
LYAVSRHVHLTTQQTEKNKKVKAKFFVCLPLQLCTEDRDGFIFPLLKLFLGWTEKKLEKKNC